MARIVYRIVSHHAGGYAVEVGPRSDIQRVRSGFETRDEAKVWVAEQVTAAAGTDEWVRGG